MPLLLLQLLLLVPLSPTSADVCFLPQGVLRLRGRSFLSATTIIGVMFSASAAALHMDMDMDDDCLMSNSSRHDMQPNNPSCSSSLSKAELRKSNKPIMEKKRRARINHCLNELKSLILDAMKKDPARHSKLEKADILEMTVKHLQSVQRQQLTVAVSTDPGVLHKFKTGFSECASEVGRYVSRLDGVEPSVRQRLSNHLNQCVNGLQQIAPPTTSPLSFPAGPSGVVGVAAPTPVQGTPNASPQMPFPAGDVNNNNTLRNSVQLIPSRLPSGELAFVLPSNAANPPYFPAPASRLSAFTAVQRAPSPSRPSAATSPSSSDSDESCSSYPLSQSPSPPQSVVKPTALTIELKTMAVASGSDFNRAKGVLDFSMKPPLPPKRRVEVLGDASNSKVPRMAFAGVNFAANRLMVEAENAPRHPSGLHGPAGGPHDSMWRPW